jgi:hypothetical protein
MKKKHYSLDKLLAEAAPAKELEAKKEQPTAKKNVDGETWDKIFNAIFSGKIKYVQGMDDKYITIKFNPNDPTVTLYKDFLEGQFQGDFSKTTTNDVWKRKARITEFTIGGKEGKDGVPAREVSVDGLDMKEGLFRLKLLPTSGKEKDKREQIIAKFNAFYNVFKLYIVVGVAQDYLKVFQDNAFDIVNSFITEEATTMTIDASPSPVVSQTTSDNKVTQGELHSTETDNEAPSPEETQNINENKKVMGQLKAKLDAVFNRDVISVYDGIMQGTSQRKGLLPVIKNLLSEMLRNFGQPLNEEYLKFYDVIKIEDITPIDKYSVLTEAILVNQLTKIYKTVAKSMKMQGVDKKKILNKLVGKETEQQIKERAQKVVDDTRESFDEMLDVNNEELVKTFNAQQFYKTIVDQNNKYLEKLNSEIKLD